jgi:hypothetical protein
MLVQSPFGVPLTSGPNSGSVLFVGGNADVTATGLEFAHSSRDGAVIHADISPSNILRTMPWGLSGSNASGNAEVLGKRLGDDP